MSIDNLVREPSKPVVTWTNLRGKNGELYKKTYPKNLGWVREHSKEAVQVELIALDQGKGELVVYGSKHGSHGIYDWIYQCTFASYEIMMSWYRRQRNLLSNPVTLKACMNGTFKIG